jgi:hypothetical protein
MVAPDTYKDTLEICKVGIITFLPFGVSRVWVLSRRLTTGYHPTRFKYWA